MDSLQTIKATVNQINGTKIILHFNDGQTLSINLENLPAGIKLNDELNVIFSKSDHKTHVKNILNAILKPHE